MSVTRVDQSLVAETSSPASGDLGAEQSASRRRGSLVVNLCSSSKKRSVTTTTHHHSQLHEQRTTFGKAASAAAASSSSSLSRGAESPLDDLREKLASQGASLAGPSAWSAPRTQVAAGHHQVIRYSKCASALTSGKLNARAQAAAAHWPKSAPATLSDEAPTNASADFKPKLSRQLTLDHRNNHHQHHHHQHHHHQIAATPPTPMQVVELTADEKTSEPVVELRNSSSSSAASSAASSACNSPLSSRQSSDCGGPGATASGLRAELSCTATTAAARQAQHQESSSSSSSSRTIRRRTVRRSFHTRATESSNERSSTSAASSSTAAAAAASSSRRVLASSGAQLVVPCTPEENEEDVEGEEEEEKEREDRGQASKLIERTQALEKQQEVSHSAAATATGSAAAATTTTTATSSSSQASSIDLSASTTSKHQETRQMNQTVSTSLFERRNRVAEVEQLRSRRSIETEQESIRRESFNGSSNNLASGSASASLSRAAGDTSSSSTRTTFGEAILSRQQHHSTSSSMQTHAALKSNHHHEHHHHQSTSDFSAASASFQTASASSSSASSSTAAAAASALFGGGSSANRGARATLSRPFLEPAGPLFGGLFSSPDVRNLVHEIGTDFAELENALSSTMAPRAAIAAAPRLALPAPNAENSSPSASGKSLLVAEMAPPSAARAHERDISELLDETRSTLRQMEENPPSSAARPGALATQSSLSDENSLRIRQLLDRANNCTGATSRTVSEAEARLARLERANNSCAIQQASGGQALCPSVAVVDSRRQAVMNESIVRIDQRMSDLCQKLRQTDACDTQKAIDLLKIMIQMVEKAWSVPVCGDDLGFKLCNSLREAGGLDIVLGSIQTIGANALERDGPSSGQQQQQHSPPGAARKQQLRLSMPNAAHTSTSACSAGEQTGAQRDTDTDTLTSDLGLDSASLESVSYTTAPSSERACLEQPEATQQQQQQQQTAGSNASPERDDTSRAAGRPDEQQLVDEEELERMRKDELLFLSARLLSQCLTSDNRDYIVRSGQLDFVIKLACQFATMKSKQSKRLLKRSALMSRQSSSIKLKTAGVALIEPAAAAASATGAESSASDQQQVVVAVAPKRISQDQGAAAAAELGEQAQAQPQTSDVHSAIGSEILQHLFKHSEETCSRMISLGALQAILYGCRLAHRETLRHCASALANLALYGGPDSQQTMIEQKAHVWLFPLAFNEADNVRYYACLAIVVLAANQEIEADVLKSGTLDLVEPFVTAHEPRQFAESTTAHIHGQSASWLRKLMPLLESKREEARNLACFHFAMEAYIKREQGQTELFKQIGALELLRRAASSPIAIASRFACQALRLCGEREPHKLSQQVPLWTCKDVCEWVGQVGFERYCDAFHQSHVDGDLLLQLDDEMLRFDLGLDNGIVRRRFMRELANLKRIADYSSVDRTGLGALLVQAAAQALEGPPSVHRHHQTAAAASAVVGHNRNLQLNQHLHHHHHHQGALMLPSGDGGVPGSALQTMPSNKAAASMNARDFVQYIYPILQLGVTRDNIHLVDCDQLLAECKITNALHRCKLAHSIRELQDRMLREAVACEEERQRALSGDLSEQSALKTLDVFVSYRRSTGSQLASLLKVHLQLRGFSVFIDVERLEAGKFDNNLLESIQAAKNFILVLSPNALDRCIGDHERKDWVHKEIVAALAANCNIIPIIDNFHWPDPEQLPEDMRSITYFNGVRWIHDYQDACVDKVERFIRGEFSNSTNTVSSIISGPGSVCSQPSIATSATPLQQVASQQQQQQQRLAGGAPPTSTNNNHQQFSTSNTTANASNSGAQIPSTPLIFGAAAAIAGQSTPLYSSAKTPLLSLTGTHPSETDSHPLALAQHASSSNHQFSGTLSTGPSNYRLR